jgi:cyclase
MLKNRLIAVIIVRDGQVVQSVKFQHTNVIHYDAFHAVEAFNRWSVDEIILINVSRERSTRDSFLAIVEHVSKTCFVPLSVGGWVDREDYAHSLLLNGADKIILNSVLHTDPDLVRKLSSQLGKQCIVASIDCKAIDGVPLVHIDRGRQMISKPPHLWASLAETVGVGEIFLNSIDHDGNRRGYDLETLKAVSHAVSIPTIAFGGAFKWQDFVNGINAGADAVAAANIFHYTEHSTKKAKRFMRDHGINVRQEGI